MNINNTDQTGQKILEKIKENHIKPTPKWEFTLKNLAFWSVFVVALSIGSLSTSVMIFMFNHTDWQDYLFAEGVVQQILINLPFFWFFLVIIFIAVAFYNFEHTKTGYKHQPIIVVIISIVLSVIIGCAVYTVGGGEMLEEIFYERLPLYQQIVIHQGRLYTAPEQGRLAGVVIEVNDNQIIIQDFSGRIWEISTSTSQFGVGERIHLLGQINSNGQFECNMIKPWFKPHQPLFQSKNSAQPMPSKLP